MGVLAPPLQENCLGGQKRCAALQTAHLSYDDHGCPIRRAATRRYVRNLQVLQLSCLRIATNAVWYVGNRQIQEDLRIPLFADHIRALTGSFDPNVADAEKP
jgi:hypothetical protein